jgi:hypothetical protein
MFSISELAALTSTRFQDNVKALQRARRLTLNSDHKGGSVSRDLLIFKGS